MKCDEALEQVPDLVLGNLTEIDEAALRRHLRGCSACRADASELDQGVALFARAAHVADPPPELRDRVIAVLEDEWADAPAAPRRARHFVISWQAVAAVLVFLMGLAAWGGIAQIQANRFGADALHYRHFLGALGGKEVRVGNLSATGSVPVTGSVVMYDAHEGQSWVLVLAKAPGYSQPMTVTLRGNGGSKIQVPFPLNFENDGEGWTGMVTSSDISSFTAVVLSAPGGQILAEGHVGE